MVVLFQEVTEGLPEEFAGLHQELHGGLIKPRVSCFLKPFRVLEKVQSAVIHHIKLVVGFRRFVLSQVEFALLMLCMQPPCLRP